MLLICAISNSKLPFKGCKEDIGKEIFWRKFGFPLKYLLYNIKIPFV